MKKKISKKTKKILIWTGVTIVVIAGGYALYKIGYQNGSLDTDNWNGDVASILEGTYDWEKPFPDHPLGSPQY
jgi:hypothetical protein